MRRSRLFGTLAAVTIIAALVTGCGEDDGDTGSSETQSTEKSTPVIIEVIEDNGAIQDAGRTVEAEVGQEIQLNVSSDEADEIHVHSDPEHTFEVEADSDETFTFTIDSPGTYEVESHHLEVVIVKLQVS
jgi:hypothetical protein